MSIQQPDLDDEMLEESSFQYPLIVDLLDDHSAAEFAIADSKSARVQLEKIRLSLKMSQKQRMKAPYAGELQRMFHRHLVPSKFEKVYLMGPTDTAWAGTLNK